MLQIAPGWSLDVERGPDWLLVKLHCDPEHLDDDPPLAERIWDLLTQHMTHRLVLECNEIDHLHSSLIGQLVLLHKRLTTQDGVMRLCGLSPENMMVLRACRLEDRFPAYESRDEAVLGHRPAKPR
jgi:anti-anti-sigma factor